MASEQITWRARARALGLDPGEVKKVSSRYDMYREYTDAQEGTESLDLERWYKWYRVEKISEGHGLAMPPVQGCSVETGTETSDEVVSEPDFLELLHAYRGDR
ncbi:MAG: hypothetical protein ACR2QG_07225 [Gammaproteobacteria bacterium]